MVFILGDSGRVERQPEKTKQRKHTMSFDQPFVLLHDFVIKGGFEHHGTSKQAQIF